MCKTNCGATFDCLWANNIEMKVCTLLRDSLYFAPLCYSSPIYSDNETNYPQIADTHLLASYITEGKFSGVVILSTLQTHQGLLLMLAKMVKSGHVKSSWYRLSQVRTGHVWSRHDKSIGSSQIKSRQFKSSCNSSNQIMTGQVKLELIKSDR